MDILKRAYQKARKEVDAKTPKINHKKAYKEARKVADAWLNMR